MHAAPPRPACRLAASKPRFFASKISPPNKGLAGVHYSKYDDSVCSKLFLFQEQNNFRTCCP